MSGGVAVGLLILVALIRFDSMGTRERQSREAPAAGRPTYTMSRSPELRVVNDTVQGMVTDIWLLRFPGLRIRPAY